ncbi:MAG TPA: ribonuclease Z [Candidatus Pacearchaeota archaeon]|nr:ribonuclease Z [Candidatus Pacearchaeota archaeon]
MTSKIKINFLGTSAQIPTAKKNHTAILLTYEGENILVDCGEGTQRQFRIAELNPCKVTRILITHWHSDHVLGIPGFLSTLALSGYNRTLYIYGPKGTKEFMRDLLKVFNFQKKYEIIVVETDGGKFYETKDFYLESERMQHGIPTNAYSFVIKDKLRLNKKKIEKSKLPFGPLLKNLKEGNDIIYGGKKYKAKDFLYGEKGKKISLVLDTLLNEKIVPFVKNSDLLICESSFSSKNNKEAKEHLHLTAKECGEIAKKSKSQKLVLTHISQRYENNLKELLKEAKKEFKNVSIANDFDEISL